MIKCTHGNLLSTIEKDKIVFVSGAMLFKSGFYRLFDKTIFVEASDNIRLERLMKRNNLTKEAALKRLNLQDDSKGADIIIKNNSDIFELKEKKSFHLYSGY